MDKKARSKCWFEMSVAGKVLGKLVFELYDDITPKTAENFFTICSGTKDLTYKGSPFHRIIPGFMLQGGDITRGDGRGGKSIWGEKFPDENFKVKHTKKYQLSMANAGPNTNGSQFFITVEKCTWLDGKHVVFGEVVEGFEIVDTLEKYGSDSGTTSKKITVSDCGAL